MLRLVDDIHGDGSMEEMLAWWREDGLHFGRRPQPRLVHADDVRVRVVIAGICRTDVALAEGRLQCIEPRVLGHEVAGIVDAVGPAVSQWQPGDCVAVRPIISEKGRTVRFGIDRDGGFADLFVVPQASLARVPAGLDWRRAAYVEPVAATLAVQRAPLVGMVGVIGDGRIAELTRRVLRAIGVDVVEGPGLDVAIETGASAQSLAQAMDAVRDGGLVVLKGRPPVPVAFDVSAAVSRELRFHAVGWASLEEAFALLASPRFDVDDLLGCIHPLDALGDLLQADEHAKRFLAPSPALARAAPGAVPCAG